MCLATCINIVDRTAWPAAARPTPPAPNTWQLCGLDLGPGIVKAPTTAVALWRWITVHGEFSIEPRQPHNAHPTTGCACTLVVERLGTAWSEACLPLPTTRAARPDAPGVMVNATACATIPLRSLPPSGCGPNHVRSRDLDSVALTRASSHLGFGIPLSAATCLRPYSIARPHFFQ
jgi:hypothetical protein